MSENNAVSVEVGEPNWAPLESALPRSQCASFMYMGSSGDIVLYKHWSTRRYLNISSDGQRFYRYISTGYVEVTRQEALDYVGR